MTPTLLYSHVVKTLPDCGNTVAYYWAFSQRFVETFKKYKPTIPYRLIVACCGGWPEANDRALFDGVASDFQVYTGFGWDNGCMQHLGLIQDSEFVIGIASPAYFYMNGWLERMVEARNRYGPGLYGPMGSYEVSPHIRTSFWGFSPRILKGYPLLIDDRIKAGIAEANGPSFTKWHTESGYPVIMVAADGFYEQSEWRKPDNVFRRGDQTNCLVWDRHCDIYRNSDNAMKNKLERDANGL